MGQVAASAPILFGIDDALRLIFVGLWMFRRVGIPGTSSQQKRAANNKE